MKSTARAAADSPAPTRPGDKASLLEAVSDDEAASYSEDEAILYALAVGFGSEPAEPAELAYAYRQPHLKTVPTFATMLPRTAFPSADDGWNARAPLYAEQKLELYRPLPTNAGLLVNRRVSDLAANDSDEPLRIVVHSDVRLASDDTALFALSSVLVPAAGTAAARDLPPAVARCTLPPRDPDLACELPTRPDQALVFCLTGDHSSYHVDAAAAKSAGFDRPTLHARCVLGIACRAILRTICGYDFTLIRAIEGRFTAPVYPGDVVTTDMWQERNVVSFRCSVRARDSVVLDGGRCTLSS